LRRRAQRASQFASNLAMPADARGFLRALAACCLTFFGFVQSSQAQAAMDCEQAGTAAEQRFGLPPGLLLAIGKVESGRWNAAQGRMIPWPWSVDVDGEGQMFGNSQDAVSAASAAQTAGRHSIDVGCFQISLLNHPDAFADLDQAFDPQANAQYAAHFLATLQVRLGNWQDAVAAYHSATPELGLPYRERVYAAWSGATPVSQVLGVQFAAFPGIHVWAPSATGGGPAVIAIPATLPQSSPPSLPQVITPTR
jgi:hypothetical protein